MLISSVEQKGIEKLIVVQLVKTFSSLHELGKFITVLGYR
jgi:hypothetical protein